MRTVCGKKFPEKGTPGVCEECGRPGTFRWHNGLPAGTHCDGCWQDLLYDYDNG